MPRITAKLIMPIIGLLLFARFSYHWLNPATSVTESNGRYLHWGYFRLDSDPLNRHPKVTPDPCQGQEPNFTTWELRAVWVDPGYVETALVVSALPAFLIGGVLVRELGHLGISQVTTFMVCMPILIVCWYYFVGWLGQRFRQRLARRQ